MQIIPAIDILNGKCVRLKQGRYDQETVYSEDPLAMAKQWQAKGAKRLHLVDLDGAKTGSPTNIAIIKKIAKEVKIPVQVGGGIRSLATIQELLDAGIDRVIMGTAAVKNPELLSQACKKFGGKIAVSIDAKAGKVATEGWTEVSQKDAVSLAQELINIGVKRFVYTDISRDGMLTGPNFKEIKKFVSQTKALVIASGGVSSKEDIENLKETDAEGCIVGKALYEGKVRLEEIL